MRTLCTLLWLMLAPVAVAAPWYPVPLEVDGQLRPYQPLANASQPWRVCALLPQGKDRYWWGVAWGLAEEAKRQGVQLGIYEAGGYQYANMQQAQLARCRQLGVDAVLVGAISADGLCADIDQLRRRGVAVIDLINRTDCAGVRAHSRGDFAQMVKAAFAYIREDSGERPIRVGWLPGPEDAGWVLDGERGLAEALVGSQVTLVAGGHGAADRATQARLVRELLAQAPDLDYLLANAEAADFAAQLLHGDGGKGGPQVVAVYANDRVLESIIAGRILAAPTDSPVLQARVAIDLAVRALERRDLPRLVSPPIQMLDRHSVAGFDRTRLIQPDGQWMVRQELPE
ncbi:TMAO reductase system periplasmic protein TorT [Pseudomonas sp. UL073]|uniref:TMAO reductase system periplasmic protein TorT n=1 Tax=Zestomonas insulae TaxID=2809017 RepID=A0ABS2IGV3_9GAMM|nr:TMAO reductase system periplasmic protein TorT [Pseudomonas insulae]MBM7062299.1 TMAO reductase system periplasmic protein TorT [Pseudomonas insulae]